MQDTIDRPLNIVLVDDDPDDAMFLNRCLGRCSELTNRQYFFTYYENPFEFLDDVDQERKPIDLLFLDIKMPQLDGYDVLRRLRTNRKTQDTPVVIYSSSANTPLIDEANALGANGAVTKTDKLCALSEAVCAQIRALA